MPENKFSVYDKNKSKIDLTKVQISYQPDCQNDEQTLLVIFDYGINGQYGCSHVARVQYFYYCSDAMKAIMDKYPLNPYIEIGDPDAFCKIKNPSNGGETDFAYLAKALMEASEKASKDFNYDSDRFCEEYLSLDAKEKCTRFDTTFSTIVHELGHAFGLGDEYAFSRTNLIDYTYGPDVRDISKSVMKDGNRLWPTCDDVLGLVFMFDRLSDYKRGTVSDICPWRNGSYTSSGIQEGNWDYYNPDGGKPEWRITYKSGKRHGLALFYNQEEKFSSCQRFNNGKLCGNMYEYRNDRRTIDNIYGDQLYDDQDISDVKDCPSDIPQCPETNN